MPYTPTTRIVQDLVTYFTVNPDFKTAFDDSFNCAKAINLPVFKEFHIDSVDDYLRYMDEYVHWVPSETLSGTNVYNHLCLFYFILDLPPVRDHQSPIDPSSHSPWRWLSEWLIKYAQEMGKWMDGPGSINAEIIETFANSPAYRDIDVAQFYHQYPVPPDGWKTFNEFFTRKINLELRPIASPDDPTVIVCPADCKFGGDWPINETAQVEFSVKNVPWNISQLLDDEVSNTHFGPLFAGGRFTHSFLKPTNYHRQHAPVSGRVIVAKVIPGLCYLEVVLKMDDTGSTRPRLAMHRRIERVAEDPTIIPYHAVIRKNETAGAVPTTYSPGIQAPDSPGYQFLQARGMILIESEIGLVAVLPIGMAQVSSVVLNVKPGDQVKKGQEISRFCFGGSDIVMVFQKQANVKLDQQPAKGEDFTKFGSQIGKAEYVSKPE